MRSYKQFQPTSFDCKGLNLPDRQDWLVLVRRNRDSDTLQESNFACALELLGGESETVEVHRFGHWANGWFELILVAPDSAASKEAETIEANLENYPVLDDDDWSYRQSEEEQEAWTSYGARDMRRALREEYPGTDARWDVVPDGILRAALAEASDDKNICGGPGYEHTSEGVSYDFEELFKRADVRSYVLWAISEHRTHERIKAFDKAHRIRMGYQSAD